MPVSVEQSERADLDGGTRTSRRTRPTTEQWAARSADTARNGSITDRERNRRYASQSPDWLVAYGRRVARGGPEQAAVVA